MSVEMTSNDVIDVKEVVAVGGEDGGKKMIHKDGSKVEYRAFLEGQERPFGNGSPCSR
jgi:hypothetical protein